MIPQVSSCGSVKNALSSGHSGSVGAWLGARDGNGDGALDGNPVGRLVGDRVGLRDGAGVGCLDGHGVGCLDGACVGHRDGARVGLGVGGRVGLDVGYGVGALVGAAVVGLLVGAAHSSTFSALRSHRPLAQSRSARQLLPVPQGSQSPPPQSTAVSSPFFQASVHVARVGARVGRCVG